MSEDTKKTYLVTNRSASGVSYAIPELGIKNRHFMPGETKKIKQEELENLTYLPGGVELLKRYLQVQDLELRADLVGHTEPEYDMTIEQVKELIVSGSHDEWLDCLDFAPEGVIDLIKTLSIEIPLTDTVKMETFKQKKGVDLARMIQIRKEEEAEEAAVKAQQAQQNQRRVQPNTQAKPQEKTTTRRTSGSKYKVVKKDETTKE